MNKLHRLTSSLLVLTLLPLLGNTADRVGDFSLLDQSGVFHQMSWYDDHTAIALLVQDNDSAIAVAEFDALKAKYDSQGIEFMMINPMAQLNREQIQAWVAQQGVDIPVLMDDTQIISEALGIEKTGEVLKQVPSDGILQIAANLRDLSGILVELEG